MKNLYRYPTLFLLTLGLAITACKKDEADPPANPGGGGNNNSTPSTTPVYDDGDAMLAAVRVFSTQSTPIGPVDVTLGTASAAFSNDGFSSFVSAGSVSCNSQSLTPQSNNVYVHQPSAANPTGIDLTASNEVTWTITGGNGFNAFTRTVPGPFPNVGAITSSTTVVRANGYTLTAASVLSADSVIFTLGSLSRTLPGNATACTFSASELNGLAAGASLAQVVPYRATREVVEGKVVYFVKEASRSISITVQ